MPYECFSYEYDHAYLVTFNCDCSGIILATVAADIVLNTTQNRPLRRVPSSKNSREDLWGMRYASEVRLTRSRPKGACELLVLGKFEAELQLSFLCSPPPVNVQGCRCTRAT